MVIIHVHIHVKPERVEDFKRATLENARNSLKEPGVVRFDFLRQKDDPNRFVLIEIYRSTEDSGRHKETAHYRKWRDTVADWMAEPRKGISYEALFPA
jgi:(4S)-4-hydroxy-5-phosphonooxypentane-2,3-dione isomerase